MVIFWDRVWCDDPIPADPADPVLVNPLAGDGSLLFVHVLVHVLAHDFRKEKKDAL